VVVLDRGKGLRDILVETGKELVDMGADGLTTTGGFLALFQDDLADACGVPVASSSLMQIPLVQRMLPRGKRVGVITVHGGKLKPDYLKIVGADPDTPVIGTEGGKELTRALLEEGATLDVAAAERDLIDAGRTLVTANPDIGALVLECHNMAPYSHGLHQALKLPIYDLYSFICWFQAGLSPRMFGRPGTYPPSVS
jgi:hypothetical protein